MLVGSRRRKRAGFAQQHVIAPVALRAARAGVCRSSCSTSFGSFSSSSSFDSSRNFSRFSRSSSSSSATLNEISARSARVRQPACNKCSVGQLPQKWGKKCLEKPKGYPAAVSLCRPPGMGGKQTLNNKISASVGRPWRTRRGGRARARRAGRRGGRARGAVTACSSSWQEYKEGISLQL